MKTIDLLAQRLAKARNKSLEAGRRADEAYAAHEEARTAERLAAQEIREYVSSRVARAGVEWGEFR